MIQVQELTKKYGAKTVVDNASFTVQPGIVTGFLGPNGAGKSTTMRMIVGLANPTGGQVLVNGKNFKSSTHPLTEVGTLLEAKSVHKSLTPRSHLRAMAATAGLPASRVDEVLELTGLAPVQRKKVGGFSLGMGQRLGIATALLGDPQVLILDEPVNGLDPEGVAWVRNLARQQAAAGKTVFISSHLMSEMAQTADHVIVMGRGRVLADAPLADLVRSWTRNTVRVRTPRPAELAAAVGAPDVEIVSSAPDLLDIVGLPAARIGDLAAERGIPLHELTPTTGSLEDAYLALTGDAVEYRTKELS